MSQNNRNKRRAAYVRGGASASHALRARDPRIGQSPRDEKGRSTLDRQKPAKTEDGVRAQLLEKIGQAGIDAIFAVAKRDRKRGS